MTLTLVKELTLDKEMIDNEISEREVETNRPRRSNDPNRCKKCRTRIKNYRELFCKRCGLRYDRRPSFPTYLGI